MITLARLIGWLPGAVGAYGVTPNGCWFADSHSKHCAEQLTSKTPLRHIISGYLEGKGDSD
jgi:hypothetical protein